MSAQTTGGTTANPRLIDQGDIDVAQSTGPMVWRANTGQDPYTDPELETTMCQTFSYFTLDVFLVKRNTDELSDIETVTDIPTDGSVDMSWGPRGTSAWDTMADAFTLAGVDSPEQTFDLEVMGLGDQAGAMRDGRIDIATVYTANTQTIIGWIQELSSTTDLEVVTFPFGESEVEQADPPLIYSETPADVFDQDIGVDSFPTISIGYFTTIPADIPAEPVYEMTRILMENTEQVHNANAVLSEHGPDFATEFLVRNGEVPVHPGTEQYYRENDLWSDDLTSLEEYEG
jgi:TRAP transporter TAXI family solute receptor